MFVYISCQLTSNYPDSSWNGNAKGVEVAVIDMTQAPRGANRYHLIILLDFLFNAFFAHLIIVFLHVQP